jgi:hypothetical protein
VRIRYEGLTEYRGADIPSVASFTVDLVRDVSAMMIATGLADWLMDSFKGRPRKVTIKRRVIELDDRGRVRRLLEEVITEETN